MRPSGLVSGDLLDRPQVPPAAENETDGSVLIWMFPIYGMAFLFAPLSKLLRRRSAWFRGSVYMCLIFLTEYVSGTILKKRNCCPWDYSHAKLNIHGIIRLDYAPVWFLTGLLYERFLTRADRRKTL